MQSKHLNIYADTCAIRHALSLKEDAGRFIAKVSAELHEDAKAFWSLVDQEGVTMYYSSLADYHLQERFGGDWTDKLKKSLRVPVPLVKADGRFNADGSAVAGGRYGGSLQAVYRSEDECDIQHLEAALEAEADYFVTTDYDFLKRLRQSKEADAAVQKAKLIAHSPAEALAQRT